MRVSLPPTCAQTAARPKPRQPSGSTEGIPINVLPLESYQQRKAALTDAQTRLSLDLIEERVAVDPFHRVNREQVGNVIWDKSEPGLAVAYAIEGHTILRLTFVLLFEA
jgi:hypothetical protein